MDPDANLKEQREIIARLLDWNDEGDVSEQANRLAELAQALDEWLTKGGFLPAPWRVFQAANEARLLDRYRARMHDIAENLDGACKHNPNRPDPDCYLCTALRIAQQETV